MRFGLRPHRPYLTGLFRAVPASCPSWRLKDPGFFQLLLRRLARPCIDMGLEYLKQLQGNMQTKGRKCNFVLKWLYKSGSDGGPWQRCFVTYFCVLNISVEHDSFCTVTQTHTVLLPQPILNPKNQLLTLKRLFKSGEDHPKPPRFYWRLDLKFWLFGCCYCG